MASLSFRGIGKTYAGGVIGAKDINLEVEDKEFLILVGPSGYTGNGDNVKSNNSHWYNVRVAWGVGTLQARANQITNTYSFDIQRFIDTRSYGQLLGAAPNVEHFSINVTKELYSSNTPHSAISFEQGYAEWSPSTRSLPRTPCPHGCQCAPPRALLLHRDVRKAPL